MGLTIGSRGGEPLCPGERCRPPWGRPLGGMSPPSGRPAGRHGAPGGRAETVRQGKRRLDRDRDCLAVQQAVTERLVETEMVRQGQRLLHGQTDRHGAPDSGDEDKDG